MFWTIVDKFLPKTFFKTQNLKDVRNASKNYQNSNLGKQRERSLCSLKIEISTNFPTNFIPSKLLPKTFSKPKIQRTYATHPKTTKIQNLGKQRERSLCSLKIKISTNLPTNCIPSKILTQNVFQNPKFKGRTQCIQKLPKFKI